MGDGSEYHHHVMCVTARLLRSTSQSPTKSRMATNFHVSVTCPNQACQYPMSLGCLDKEGCFSASGDWDYCQLVCQRCGTRFQLACGNLSLWPVIINPNASRGAEASTLVAPHEFGKR